MEKIFKELARLMENCISSLECAHRIVSQECDQELVDKLETDGESDAVYYTKKLADLKKKFSEECCRRQTGEEAGQALERFVNVMCNRDENKEFVEYIVHRTHRTLNQGIMGLVFDIIKEEAKLAETMRYDARNEASVMACKKLSKELEDVYLPFI